MAHRYSADNGLLCGEILASIAGMITLIEIPLELRKHDPDQQYFFILQARD
jgi:hypothetical protein